MKRSATLIALLALMFVSMYMVQPAGAEVKKDHMKAFLLSFILPGLGEFYAGSPGYGKLYIAAELAIWGGYYYNTTMKHSRRQDYLLQGVLHAGADPSATGTSYLNAVGSYSSSFDYNQAQLQMKDAPVLYTGSRGWKWDSEAERDQFKYLRERELDYDNNIKYCIAGAVLNHFLSGLHASKLIRQSSKDMSLGVTVLDKGLAATYRRSF
ncbi:MAG: hypothetical protein WCU00_10610 [Candidatus Latescibacterota bacterium]